MKKQGNKLPVKSQMVDADEKPAKSVMKAIGASLLKPAKKKKKAPKDPDQETALDEIKEEKAQKPQDF